MKTLLLFVFLTGCYGSHENGLVIADDIGVMDCELDKDCPDYQRQDCLDNVCEYVDVVAFARASANGETLELSLKGDIVYEETKKYKLRTVKNTSKMVVNWSYQGPEIDLEIDEFIFTGNITEKYTFVTGEWTQITENASSATAILEDATINDRLEVEVNFIEL